MSDVKVPTRPGSQWATGKRREPKRYRSEPKGFFRGAKVTPHRTKS